MTKREPEIDSDELNTLAEIALRRVSELGLNEDEAALLLGDSSRNSAGCTEDWRWDEVKGTIAAATWSKERIMRWLDEASESFVTKDGRLVSARGGA